MRLLLVCLAAAALAVPSALARSDEGARVAAVIDGDTIALTTGTRVRLLQIDTPEVGSGECYSRAAARELRRLLPVGTSVTLEADAALDRVDRYGRLLRYVRVGGRNVNVELVRRGAATVYLYRGERGRYAGSLLSAARDARSARRGLWGACRAIWDPSGLATTSPKATSSSGGGGGGCDPSYPDFCIPSPPPDLDCADIAQHGFRVVGDDPHRFDGDRDGVGCE
jgi:micrococcal nuclease